MKTKRKQIREGERERAKYRGKERDTNNNRESY